MDKGERKGILTPRQKKYLEYYNSPDSDSFSNAYKSAIKAGYSKNTAVAMRRNESITVTQKNAEILDNEGMKNKIIAKLERIIDALEDSDLRDKMKLSSDNVLKSLELLGKWQKLFTDRVEVTGGITVVGYLPGESGYKQVGVIDVLAEIAGTGSQ